MDEQKRSSWKTEIQDLMRGLSGGFIFGIPLLYTMEVWWKGDYISPERMLGALAITFAALVMLNYAAGFRQIQTSDWSQILGDSVTGLVLALFAAWISLMLIGSLGFTMGLQAIMGRVILEAIPFGIGAGISNYLLLSPAERTAGKEPQANGGNENKSTLQGTAADAGATALGATVIAFSIAPTDEVRMIASGLSYPRLLILIGASLVVSYMIVFEAGFSDQEKREQQRGVFQHPFSETIFAYIISLTVSTGVLWLFQMLTLDNAPEVWMTYVIVLGLPCTIGGAAGRVVV